MARNAEPAGATPTSVEARSLGTHPVRTADVAARVLAWGAGIVAIVGLASWALGITARTGVVFALHPMVPMTATTIALCSAAIIAGYSARSPRSLGKLLAAVALLVGLTALAHDAMGIARGTVGFDATFIDEVSPGASGWLAPNTAVSLALIGLALLLEPRQAEGHAARRHFISVAATAALLFAILTLVGSIYGVDPLRGLPGHLSMSINTAIAIAMLAVAVLLQSTGGGLGDLIRGHDAGAVLARLALPAAIILPLVLGALKLVSDRAGWFGPTVGTAVRTIVEMMLFAGLALLAIARLRRVDRERERLMDEERQARASAEEAQAMLEEHAEALEEQAQELETTVEELRSANESLEAQRTIADAARSAEIQSRSLLDAIIDQLPVGVVLARMPSGEVVRRNRVGEEIAAALNRGDRSPRDAIIWHRADGTPYTREEYPLNRTVKTAEVIDQEEMTARVSDGSSCTSRSAPSLFTRKASRRWPPRYSRTPRRDAQQRRRSRSETPCWRASSAHPLS